MLKIENEQKLINKIHEISKDISFFFKNEEDLFKEFSKLDFIKSLIFYFVSSFDLSCEEAKDYLNNIRDNYIYVKKNENSPEMNTH